MNELKLDGAAEQLEEYAALIAIDWADRKHAFCLVAAGQKAREKGELEQTPEVICAWMTKLRERFGGRPVAVAVEQSRGALIHALLEYDFVVVYPLHPVTVARFREAFRFSGAKSDPLDTEQILEILTKHRDLLKPLRPDGEQTRLLQRLVRDRRKVVDMRTSQVQALLASLKEYYPQAIEVLNGNVTSRLAGDFLKKWPSFEKFQQAKASTIKAFFHGHNVRSPKAIEKAVRVAEQSKALTTDGAIVASGALLSQTLAASIQRLNPAIKEYESRIEKVFHDHADAKLFDHLPGAGRALAPRLLAFFGTDRARFDSAASAQSFCGIAPVTASSGRSRVVRVRRACPKFLRQTMHEFAGLSVAQCQWAQNYVAFHKARGKKHHTVIRALAFKWIRILFQCWKTRKPYDEQAYLEQLKKSGSIFGTMHLEKN